jgi:DNA-binding Xre family transcriptional regulator
MPTIRTVTQSSHAFTNKELFNIVNSSEYIYEVVCTLNDIMEARNITQSELSERTHIRPSTIKQIRDLRNDQMDYLKLAVIAEVLDVEVQELFYIRRVKRN